MDFCKIIAYIMHCLIHAFVLSEKSAFVLRGNISVTITECLYFSDCIFKLEVRTIDWTDVQC